MAREIKKGRPTKKASEKRKSVHGMADVPDILFVGKKNVSPIVTKLFKEYVNKARVESAVKIGKHKN